MNATRKFEIYTKEEDEYILKNYKTIGPERIAKKLNRTVEGIKSRWRKGLNSGMIKGAIKDNTGLRKLRFIAAIKIVCDKNIKHDNRVPGTIEAVRAGWLDDIEIKIV